MLPLSECLQNLPSDFVPFWTVVKPVLFCAFLLVTGLTLAYIRPANVEESLLHPASFQNQFSGNLSVLFSDLACCTSIFFTSSGQTYLMSILTSPSNIKVCHCSHFMPKSRVSHITAPAASEPQESDSAMLLFVQCTMFLSVSLQPRSGWPE